MRLRGFHLGRPQRVAALLLLMLFGECLWTIGHQPLDANDYRYAHCGREMWESPSVLQGYFTTCGNLNGDGTFAYRLAGFPLTVQRAVLLGVDHFRKPADRLYAHGSLNGSTWEARHELGFVKYLLRVPFVLFAVWLGGRGVVGVETIVWAGGWSVRAGTLRVLSRDCEVCDAPQQ